MEPTGDTALTVDLRVANGSWRVVIERGGLRRELESLDELIRYLQRLPGADEAKPARGLR